MALYIEKDTGQMQNVLMISMMDGAENCARVLSDQLQVNVELATSRKAGLTALRCGVFGVVVLDESLVESDPAWGNLVWESAGMALPLQVNFAISGSVRLGRELKAALARREGEHQQAWRAATRQLENELKSSVTGLMLESELALLEPAMSPALEPKLRHLVELAGNLRERLRNSGDAARPV